MAFELGKCAVSKGNVPLENACKEQMQTKINEYSAKVHEQKFIAQCHTELSSIENGRYTQYRAMCSVIAAN